jgi:hypothetical protein
MFPENPEINEMINILKSNQEDGAYKSTIIKKENSTFKMPASTSKTMPKIENKIVVKQEERSNKKLTYRTRG